jgi:iron complex outermembrane receptor protein
VQELGAFLEEAFNVTPRVLLIGGVRYDHIVLDRTVDDLIASTTTTFDKTWNQVSWRAGAVLDATPETQVYAQYSSAMLPVSGFLTMSQARAAFDLSRGRQVEGGIKSSMADGRVAFTAAAYWIAQDKILTRDPSNPALTIQGGEQSSIGGELSVYGELTDRLRLDGNLAVLDAKFDELVVGGGTSLKGNTPLNVPERVGNVSLSYAVPGVPVAISLTGTSVGKFFTDDFNTIEAKGYQLLGASIRFDSPLGTLVARGRNLMDEYYVAWSGYYETHVYVGEPRSFEVSWTKRIF